MDLVHFYGYRIILPIVLMLGVIGNTLNIIVLARGRFRHSLDASEKCAAAVLLAMAVSGNFKNVSLVNVTLF